MIRYWRKLAIGFIVCCIAFYLTEAVKQEAAISSAMYFAIFMYFAAVSSITAVVCKKYIKIDQTKAFAKIGSFLLALVTIVVFYQFFFPTESKTTVTLSAFGNKNESADWGEVWLLKTYCNGVETSMSNANVTNGWIYNLENDDVVFYPGNGAGTAQLELDSSENNTTMEFLMAPFCGIVGIQEGNQYIEVDMYSDVQKTYTYHVIGSGNTSISLLFLFRFIGCVSLLCFLHYLILYAFRRKKLMNSTHISDNLSRLVLPIATFHWLISFATDKIFFTYSSQSPNLWVMKLLFFVVLIFMWNFIFKFYFQVKNKNIEIVSWLKYSVIYFMFMAALLILVWPGNWVWDDIFVLNAARSLNFEYWQHSLTSIYYILAAMVFPCPGGIIVVQLVIISVIVGYIVASVVSQVNSKRYRWIILIPFFFPPMLWHNLYPLRLSLYAYLELLFIVLIIKLCFFKSDLHLKKLIGMGFLCAVLAAWRSEGIYYLVMAPLFLALCTFKRIDSFKKTVGIFSLSTLVFFIVISFPQQIYMYKNPYVANRYEISAIIDQVQSLIIASDESDAEMIEKIDTIMDVDNLLQHTSGESAYWSTDVLRTEYSENDYAAMKKTYFTLIRKYPYDYLKNAWEMFYKTSWWPSEENTRLGSIAVDYTQDTRQAFIDFSTLYRFNTSPMPKLRINLLNFLSNTLPNMNLWSIGFTWNLLLPFLFLCLIMLILLLHGKWRMFLLLSLGAVKYILIFCTAPSTYFMYYLPPYLLSYTVLAITIYWVINKKLFISTKLL